MSSPLEGSLLVQPSPNRPDPDPIVVLEPTTPPLLWAPVAPSPLDLPPPGSPPKPKRTGLIMGLIAGGVAIAVIAVLATALATKNTPTVAQPLNPVSNVAPPVVPAGTPGIGSGAATCIDTTAGSIDANALANDATDAARAASNGDLVGAAEATHRAAADAQALARDTAADPAVSAATQLAANDYASAADSLDAGDIAGATTLLLAGTREIQAGTALLEQTTVPAC
jgi:hypothetical protein